MKRRSDDDEPWDEPWDFIHPEVPYVDVELPYVTDTLLDHNGNPIFDIYNRNAVGFAVPDRTET